jgi:fermentation-respiration switch protein FrsA (DUF1100 family)
MLVLPFGLLSNNITLLGDSDELVPPSHMKQLFEAAVNSSGKDFFSVYGGQHNDTWIKAGAQYYKV